MAEGWHRSKPSRSTTQAAFAVLIPARRRRLGSELLGRRLQRCSDRLEERHDDQPEDAEQPAQDEAFAPAAALRVRHQPGQRSEHDSPDQNPDEHRSLLFTERLVASQSVNLTQRQSIL
jgi:hypothetical protein